MPQAWHLMRRPSGMPTREDFELKPVELPRLEPGMVRVRNLWLSVDPYMRGRMNEVKSYVPPFALDAPMEGGAVGEVVESRAEGIAPGTRVLHMAGWRDEAVLAAAEVNVLPDLGVEPQAFLGNLGLTGGTAYFGLLDAAQARPGDVVFVSAAAGAVGSAVVQIAKARGMTVIGSARGPAKCAFVRELGADAAVDYTAGPVVKGLAVALAELGAPAIDVYFDNVGGDHLDAALAHAARDSRFAICGMIDGYNRNEPMAFRFIMRVIAMRIRLQGFIYTDYMDRLGEFYRDMAGWIAAGEVRSRDTVVEGLDAMPDAFLGLFAGANTGKMLVRLG